MIKQCTNCPLYSNMPFGPCTSNHTGDIYCIFHLVNEDSRIADEIVTGFDKQILRKLVPENRWFLSSLVRCYSDKPVTSKTIKICSSWISEELKSNNCNKVLTFGLIPFRVFGQQKIPFTQAIFTKHHSPIIGEFLCVPTLHELGRSAKGLIQAQKIIGEYIGIR